MDDDCKEFSPSKASIHRVDIKQTKQLKQPIKNAPQTKLLPRQQIIAAKPAETESNGTNVGSVSVDASVMVNLDGAVSARAILQLRGKRNLLKKLLTAEQELRDLKSKQQNTQIVEKESTAIEAQPQQPKRTPITLDDTHPFVDRIIQEASLPFCPVLASIDDTLQFLSAYDFAKETASISQKSLSDIAAFQRFVKSDFCKEIKKLSAGTVQ